MKLNLADINNVLNDDNSNKKKLVFEGPSLGNEYLDEWRRYIKHSIENNKIDTKKDFYIEKEDIYDISIIYTSDTKERIDNIISRLVDFKYLYDVNGKFYFNKELYTDNLLELRKTKEEKLGFKRPFLKEPWEISEGTKGYYIIGKSQITKEYIDIGMVPKGSYGENYCVKNPYEVASKICEAPSLYNLLGDIYSYIKKIGNLGVLIELKEIIKSIDNFDKEIVILDRVEDLDRFICENSSSKLKAIDLSRVMGAEERIIEITDLNGPILISKVSGVDSLSIVSSIGLICKMEDIMSLLKNVNENMDIDKELKVEIESVIK